MGRERVQPEETGREGKEPVPRPSGRDVPGISPEGSPSPSPSPQASWRLISLWKNAAITFNRRINELESEVSSLRMVVMEDVSEPCEKDYSKGLPDPKEQLG